jgi:hypothetical protein
MRGSCPLVTVQDRLLPSRSEAADTVTPRDPSGVSVNDHVVAAVRAEPGADILIRPVTA